jgi:hypothetical protein
MTDTDTEPSTYDQATTMIEQAWGHPIDALEDLAHHRPVEDPLLRSAMHIRASLAVSSNAAAVHQDRLHALTRPGHTPPFYDLDRLTRTAADLRVAHAESLTSLRAIRCITDTREATLRAAPAPAARLAQAAAARSTRIPHRPAADPPTVPPAAAPPATGSTPRR